MKINYRSAREQIHTKTEREIKNTIREIYKIIIYEYKIKKKEKHTTGGYDRNY